MQNFIELLLVIQICSGITRGKVLNGELYAQTLQKLIYLHLPTDCFMKTSLHSHGKFAKAFPWSMYINLN